MRCYSLLLVGVMTSSGFAAGDAPSEANIRKAVASSLPVLERDGLAWVKKHNCNSCHQVTFMLWAHQEARAKGIAVDERKLTEWTDWSLNDSLSRRAWFSLSEDSLQKAAADKLPAAIVMKLHAVRETGAVTFNPDVTRKLEVAKVPAPVMEKLKKLKGKRYTADAELQADLEKTLTPDEIKASDLLTRLKGLKEKTFVHEAEVLAEVRKALTPEEAKEHEAKIVKHVKMGRKGAINDAGGLDTVGQLLLGGAGRSSSAHAKEFQEQAPLQIAKHREANGAFVAGGQLPDRQWERPIADQVTTMWILLALTDYGKPDDATRPMIDKAFATLKDTKPVDLLEWQALRLVLERRLGDKAKVDELQKALLDKQNKDGGWSWTLDADSDAFSTGMALYALTLAGVPGDSDTIRRAQKYLLDTQDKDGSWKNLPKKIFKPARAKRVEPIYTYWGTAWAAIGLARSLPERAVGATR